MQYIYATSNRKRDLNIDVVNLKQGIKIISNYKNYKVGILFGPERSGLTNEHIALCDKIIEIPLNKNFKSLNLAQSVLLVAYELFNLNLSKINFVFSLFSKDSVPPSRIESTSNSLSTRISTTCSSNVPIPTK